MNKHLDVFYTTAVRISDRAPYGTELKVSLAKEYANAQHRLANPDYSHLPMWQKIGRGNSLKAITSYTRKPGMRVIKGCKPFLNKDKTEMDFGLVQYFIFDIDVADKINGKELSADDMDRIMEAFERSVPRMEIADELIIGDGYSNRSGSNTGFHLILGAEQICKMSISKADKIKQWLYDVVKAKFIDEVNALGINEFVMDDKANAGMRKLFFSDSHEKLRHITLVGDYNEVMGVIDADDNNESSCRIRHDDSCQLNAIASGVPPAGAAGGVPLAIANPSCKGTIITIESAKKILTRLGIEDRVKLKEVNYNGWNSVEFIPGSITRANTKYASKVSCVAGACPSPHFYDYCNSEELYIANPLKKIFMDRAALAKNNLPAGNLPQDMKRYLDNNLSKIQTRDDVKKFIKAMGDKIIGPAFGNRQWIKSFKKMARVVFYDYLNLDFELKMNNNKVVIVDEEVQFDNIPVPYISLCTIFLKDKEVEHSTSFLSSVYRAEDHKTKSPAPEHSIVKKISPPPIEKYHDNEKMLSGLRDLRIII